MLTGPNLDSRHCRGGQSSQGNEGASQPTALACWWSRRSHDELSVSGSILVFLPSISWVSCPRHLSVAFGLLLSVWCCPCTTSGASSHSPAFKHRFFPKGRLSPVLHSYCPIRSSNRALLALSPMLFLLLWESSGDPWWFHLFWCI